MNYVVIELTVRKISTFSTHRKYETSQPKFKRPDTDALSTNHFICDCIKSEGLTTPKVYIGQPKDQRPEFPSVIDVLTHA